jgi:LPXTG-motif cell wall-anchored protein
VGLVVPVPKAAAHLTGGPDVIPAPASVVDSSAASPPGASNNHQQAFDERQGVTLTAPLAVDNGSIPVGTVVDSHMIFLNVPDRAQGVSDFNKTWTFSKPVIGVMSDGNGALEVQSSAILGAAGTLYPQAPFGARGIEPAANSGRGAGGVNGDGYTIKGNAITVGMSVAQPGDWIRVITEGTITPAPTELTAEKATLSTAVSLSAVSARLTSNGSPVAGQTISFTASDGTPICTAVTNADGRASCTSASPLTAAIPILAGGYTATFAGTDRYVPSTGHGSVELLPAPAPTISPSPPAPPVPPVTPVPPPTPTPSESPSVLGITLPRTGSGTGMALVVGALLIILGAGALIAARVRARKTGAG